MRNNLEIINQPGFANFDFLAEISDTWTASTDSLISYKIVYHGQLTRIIYSVD